MNWSLYCAHLAVSHHRLAGAEVPEGLMAHLAALTTNPGSADGTENRAVQQESNHDLIGADQAAQLLKCSSRYVRRIAADLDGQQVAGRWLFDKHAVTEYATAKAQGGWDSDH